MGEKKLYTVKEAATLFEEVTEYAIWKGIHENRIPSIRLGRKKYVTKEDVYNAIYRDFLGEYEEIVHNEDNAS